MSDDNTSESMNWSEETLYKTTDAQVWAQAFMERVKAGSAVDEYLMIAWFANAIETAKTHAVSNAEVIHRPAMDEPFDHVRACFDAARGIAAAFGWHPGYAAEFLISSLENDVILDHMIGWAMDPNRKES